ncbi:MAG TPA: DUF459 domain-containing protein [Acidimicrobiales bacterium]|nr:DUF459 domain-containing protein [Acidimicrobiales bacterium]
MGTRARQRGRLVGTGRHRRRLNARQRRRRTIRGIVLLPLLLVSCWVIVLVAASRHPGKALAAASRHSAGTSTTVRTTTTGSGSTTDPSTTTQGSTTTSSTTPPTTSSTTPATTSTQGTTPPTVTTFPPTLTPTTKAPPDIAQPSSAHQLTVLEIGDSLGIDLGWGLSAMFGSDVRFLPEAVGDTGLARPDYYDWPLHLEEYLQEYHPGAVVVFIGGNDGQSFDDQNGNYVGFGSSNWHTIYSERVAQIMDEATAAGAHVLWVGMPIMESADFSATMETLNSVYQQQASDHAGVTYVSSWGVMSTPSGQFAMELPNSTGQQVTIRDPDGVHITYAGGELLANSLLAPMDQAWHIRL